MKQDMSLEMAVEQMRSEIKDFLIEDAKISFYSRTLHINRGKEMAHKFVLEAIKVSDSEIEKIFSKFQNLK